MNDNNPLGFSPLDVLSTELLFATLDVHRDRLAVLAPTGRILLVNRAWRTSEARNVCSMGLCLYGPGQSFITSIEQSTLRSTDAWLLLKGLEEVLEGRRSGFSCECRECTPLDDSGFAGEPAWLSIDVESFEVNGSTHAQVVLHEVTSSRPGEQLPVAERCVRRIKAQLAGQSARIATLHERERARDEFIAMLAHELRGPLAPILNATDVLAIGSEDRQVSVNACEVIRRQVGMLKRLIEDLFDVSRMVRGGLELRLQPVDVREAIAGAIETARPLISQGRHALKMRIAGRPLLVDGDLSRLIQVIGNLLSNAAKYTDPGGRISIVAARVGTVVVVRVRDTGIGLCPEHLGRIFELFAQAEPRSNRTMGGLGIGLALARQLAERHGGSLTAYSDGLGCGSEFTLALPAAAVAERARTVDAPPPELAPVTPWALARADQGIAAVRG